jgi:hypothetical protein
MIENKYANWYYKIIYYAKKQERKKGNIYYESHHIIPYCISKDNSKNNLVLLTPREHFICHLLLTKMYIGENKQKMCKAFWFMRKRYKDCNLNSKLYENIKKEWSKNQSILNKKMWSNKEIREKLIKKKIGRKNTAETKLLMSKSAIERHKNNPLKEESIIAIKEKLTGRKLDPKHVSAISNAMKDKNKGPQKRKECPYCKKIVGISAWTRYHNKNCKENK